MNFFKSIAAIAAVATTTFLAVPSAEAAGRWKYIGTNATNGKLMYANVLKYYGIQGRHVQVETTSNQDQHLEPLYWNVSCDTHSAQFVNSLDEPSNSPWKDVLPGTVLSAVYNFACN